MSFYISISRSVAVSVFLAAASFPLAAQSAPAPAIAYRTMAFSPAILRSLSVVQAGVLEKLNRKDREHLARSTEVIAPDAWLDDELAYSPMPSTWDWAAPQPKVIVVDQKSQAFGAYESGRLVRWGPVSSGRQETATPAGVFHLTWRSRTRRSTDNQEWILHWYFNFVNERGVSFHEFELPGRPASHACVRLLERDAAWVYKWGESWVLAEDTRHVARPGSTVVVLGTYDFDQPAPWIRPDWYSKKIELPLDPGR